jgi:hypothetical protein
MSADSGHSECPDHTNRDRTESHGSRTQVRRRLIAVALFLSRSSYACAILHDATLPWDWTVRLLQPFGPLTYAAFGTRLHAINSRDDR